MRLERQFCLSMQAQRLCCLGETVSGGSRVKELFEEALDLTVPRLEKRGLQKLVLSIKELNLVLETERYRTAGGGKVSGERPERYREVLEYITSGRRLDRRGMAKIYPQTVYFLCGRLAETYEAEEEKGNIQEWERYAELLKYCNRALNILRDNGGMYFLWEILDMRERLMGKIEGISGSGSKGRREIMRHSGVCGRKTLIGSRCLRKAVRSFMCQRRQQIPVIYMCPRGSAVSMMWSGSAAGCWVSVQRS